jgi:hypothetical protein
MKPPIKLRGKSDSDADNVKGAKAPDFDADELNKGLLANLKVPLPPKRKSRVL